MLGITIFTDHCFVLTQILADSLSHSLFLLQLIVLQRYVLGLVSLSTESCSGVIPACGAGRDSPLCLKGKSPFLLTLRHQFPMPINNIILTIEDQPHHQLRKKVNNAIRFCITSTQKEN